MSKNLWLFLTYNLWLYLLFFFKKYLLIWLHWVLIAGSSVFVELCGIFSCSRETLSYEMLDLVPWPGIEPQPPALGVRSLSHWTTREVPCYLLLPTKKMSLTIWLYKNEVPSHWSCWPLTYPERSSGWRSRRRHSLLGKTGRTDLLIVSYFQEKILWLKFLACSHV